ncbi:hypothetical protein GW17_00034935 [Ensete ventricosum]|nr:hypothetical protein GW17_00034935 [Ensete ventricosum]
MFSQQTQQGGGWAASHGQASCRAGLPWLGHLEGGGRLWPRPRAKEQLAAAKAPYTRGGRLRPAHRCDRCLRARSLAVRRPQGRLAVGRCQQGSVASGQPVRGCSPVARP